MFSDVRKFRNYTILFYVQYVLSRNRTITVYHLKIVIFTAVKACKRLISSTYRLLTFELLGPEKTIALLLENYSKYFDDFTCWLLVERVLPFGPLVLLHFTFSVGFQ